MALAQPLLDRGLSVADTALELGLTKGALSGIMTRSRQSRARSERMRAPRVDDNSWDRRLFEPYQDRKARLARERGIA